METAGRSHFGTVLRQLRLDAGMTQQALAERANLSVEAISQLERGARTRPQRETVVLLGRALDLSADRQALLAGTIVRGHPPRSEHTGRFPAYRRLIRSDAQTAPNHNLPQQVTSFVGRQQDVNKIKALLREHRLVTVVGAGGVGKTRVAVQLAADIRDDCPDGVWLVDLARLANPDLVENAVLIALRLPSTQGSALDVLIAYLKARRLLLILDNCEQVIARAREVVGKIVEGCPSTQILATSRQVLEVAGEQVYRLPSLAVPPDSSRSARDAAAYGAIALFVDRARAANGSFAFTDDNARDVAEICRRLDGIPLAIELAAARVNVLTPRQVAQRLDQRFRLLVRGNPRALPRHQTMTASIDWSYDLLSAREQRFFESLSVFAAGCTLEAATAVCASDGEDDLDVVELVTSLVTKSLLVGEPAGSEQRYRLLESSRQYARNKLAERGAQDETALRHATFYVELGERLENASDRTADREWLAQAQAEVENWRAALEWALGKRNEVVLGQRLASLRLVLLRNFPLPEARSWVQTALDLVDERTPAALLARLEFASAGGAGQIGENQDCLAAPLRSLDRYREIGDVLGIAKAQNMAAGSLVILGRAAEAEPLLRDVLATARTLGNRRMAANALLTTGNARSMVDDFVGARAYHTEALRLAKGLDAGILTMMVASSLASNEYDAGDPEKALQLEGEVLATYRELNSSTTPVRVAHALGHMAMSLLALRRYDEAQSRASEALELAHTFRYTVLLTLSLQLLAAVALLRPQVNSRSTFAHYAVAARLFGFVEARVKALGLPERVGLRCLRQDYDRAMAVLHDALDSDELTRLMAAGTTMTEDEAIDQAHGLD